MINPETVYTNPAVEYIMLIENVAEIHELVGPYDVVVEVETKYRRWGRSSDPRF
mgnify:CR=1 FL=1